MKSSHDNPMSIPDGYFEEKAASAEKTLGIFEWTDYFREVARLIERDGGTITAVHPTKNATVHQRIEALCNLEIITLENPTGVES